MNNSEDEMLPEYDLKGLGPHKMGKGRKSWYGVPNPDYDKGFALAISEIALATTNDDDGTERAPRAATESTVTLDTDVAFHFKDAAAVNDALRYVIKIANENPLAARPAKVA